MPEQIDHASPEQSDHPKKEPSLPVVEPYFRAFFMSQRSKKMANNPIDMSKVRKVLIMHFQGKSKSFISKYLHASRNTVKKYINICHLLGLDEEYIRLKSDTELEAIFVKDNEIKIDKKL